MTQTNPILSHVREALSTVIDPEIRRPITDLDMVDELAIDDAGVVQVTILLTVAGCPLRNTIEQDVTNAVNKVPGVTGLQLRVGAMSAEQRAKLTEKLRGGAPTPVIQFAQPGSRTRVVAVASGKGGVGKSSMTVNLALELAKEGFSVGLLDADIYGHSVPDLLGIPEAARPTMVDSMIMPVPVEYVSADGKKAVLKVISMGMLKESRDQVIAWRGPILDRALTQLLAEVFWGDLDFFLIDLPPGTGDVAMSIGQKLPGSDMIVVTTPQPSVSWVSERAGTMGSMLHQNVIGVIENMSWFETTCPHCGKEHRVELFGSGGGQQTADALSDRLAREVPLLTQIPMDYALGAGAEINAPVVIAQPDSTAAQAIAIVAEHLIETKASLIGKPLGLKVNG
ncbi:P-loop NTPase [Brooklawnia sp.]|uniref:Mrp/NBP35 family ATP-binding protein n=1 Tax=Brooklawnia sp. TaxID=2699740 RepID=UPI00311EBD56